jgi:hypothetical protein
VREVTATEHQLRAENRSLDARLGESIRVEEGLRSDAVRMHAMLTKTVARLDQYALGCKCPGVSCVEHCAECDKTYGLVNEARRLLAGRR